MRELAVTPSHADLLPPGLKQPSEDLSHLHRRSGTCTLTFQSAYHTPRPYDPSNRQIAGTGGTGP